MEKYHIPWTCYPKLTWGLPILSLPLISPAYLGVGLPCLSSALRSGMALVPSFWGPIYHLTQSHQNLAHHSDHTKKAHFGVDNSPTLRGRGPRIQMVTPLCALMVGRTVVREMCSPTCLEPIMYYLMCETQRHTLHHNTGEMGNALELQVK